MANTTITFQDVDDFLVPSQASVNVVTGDTVTFTAPENTNAKLCIPPGTAAILSPTPDETNTQIPGGESVVFEFTSSSGGGYCILLQKEAYACPTSIGCPPPSGNTTVVNIYPAGPIDFDEDRTWP